MAQERITVVLNHGTRGLPCIRVTVSAALGRLAAVASLDECSQERELVAAASAA